MQGDPGVGPNPAFVFEQRLVDSRFASDPGEL